MLMMTDDPSKIISSEPQIHPLRYGSVGMTKAGHGAHILPKWIPFLIIRLLMALMIARLIISAWGFGFFAAPNSGSLPNGIPDKGTVNYVLRGWGISFRVIPVCLITNFRSRIS
jgi:hypothetical protein